MRRLPNVVEDEFKEEFEDDEDDGEVTGFLVEAGVAGGGALIVAFFAANVIELENTIKRAMSFIGYPFRDGFSESSRGIGNKALQSNDNLLKCES